MSHQKLSSAEIQELLEQRMVVQNNLAAAQMKIDALEAAMKSVETVLLCQPNNVKALYRKGKILDAKGETNEAILIFQKAATLDPENKSFQNELSKLILKRSREQRNERNLYQKMLGQAQKMEQKKAPVVKTETPTESNVCVSEKGISGATFHHLSFPLLIAVDVVLPVRFYPYWCGRSGVLQVQIRLSNGRITDGRGRENAWRSWRMDQYKN